MRVSWSEKLTLAVQATLEETDLTPLRGILIAFSEPAADFALLKCSDWNGSLMNNAEYSDSIGDILVRQLVASGVSMHRELGIRAGSPNDGFVSVDPYGYFLEFERFNIHRENISLLP